jgi:hypothetical protein
MAQALKRREQSRADVADVKNRMKIMDRKLETRLKIIGGAAVFAHARVNSVFREELRKVFDATVTRPHDRAILTEFFGELSPADSPPVRPLKSPGGPPSGAAPA